MTPQVNVAGLDTLRGRAILDRAVNVTAWLISLLLTANPCVDALAAGRSRLEKVSMEKRVRPTLTLIGKSCAQVDEALAKAATDAAKLPRAQRSAVLAKAQSECPVKDALKPAEVLLTECPPRDGDPQGSMLRHLDAGTYVFVRALRGAIFAEGSYHPDVDLVLSSLTLAAALEAEAAGEKRR